MLMTMMANTVAARGVPNRAGEKCRHTRQRSHPEIPVIQPEGAAHTLTDGAAHLKGCTLPSRAAAAQVGQDRTEKDGRQQQDRQPFSLMDRVDDIVGTQAVRLRQLVKAHDHKAANGRRYSTQGCVPRKAVTSWTPKWNMVPINPQTTPMADAAMVHFASVHP